MLNAFANRGQDFAKQSHALVFVFVAHFAPARMVAALLSAACIAARGLQMAIGARTDPDIRPGGRDDEGFDAAKSLLISDQFALRIEVAKAFAKGLARDAGLRVGDITKSCDLRRLNRICDG